MIKTVKLKVKTPTFIERAWGSEPKWFIYSKLTGNIYASVATERMAKLFVEALNDPHGYYQDGYEYVELYELDQNG